MTVDENKKKIRRIIKELKSQYSLEKKKDKSEIIWEKLTNLSTFKAAKTVMFYWSMSDEVHTHEMVSKAALSKKIILPSVDGDQLLLKEFKGISDLIPGEGFEIPEPQGNPFENKEDIDLIIVPGVAFDKHNNRMGRGKAYYDKLLSTTNAYLIGVCFDFQLLDEVPTDEHDVKMNLVLTN